MYIPTTTLTQISFTNWATYDCAPTGFSGTPTQRSSRYCIIGNVCITYIDVFGTSNAATFTFSTPVPYVRSFQAFAAQGTDNSVNPTSPFIAVFGAAPSSTVTVARTWADAGNTWTASGTKSIQVTLTFEI